MKILYFGTVCDLQRHNQLLQECQGKPSVASAVFENALLDGFHQNGAQIEICSFPMIPTFPKGSFLFYGGTEEILTSGYGCHLLKTINLPVLKQLSRRWDAVRAMKRWIRENQKDGMILLYSMPPFLVERIISFARKHQVKTVVIVPDLLRDMYANSSEGTWMSQWKQWYLKQALKFQDAFDGYIYLTEEMRHVVAPSKPYMVMEGIASVPEEPEEGGCKAQPRAVMYAGMLHEAYGIGNLMDAFEALPMEDVELWLFGMGNAVEKIQQRAAGNPRIRYLGAVSREQILRKEREASLLINPRDPREAFTHYSFPSKTIEYMLSGTPMLTTKLRGIPAEYYDYVFSAEDNQVEHLAQAMQEALSRSDHELQEMGFRARAFIIREKNAASQTAKILRFIGEIMYGAACE